MPDLTCPRCELEHSPGMTGIDGDGNPTCLDCRTPLERGVGGVDRV